MCACVFFFSFLCISPSGYELVGLQTVASWLSRAEEEVTLMLQLLRSDVTWPRH